MDHPLRLERVELAVRPWRTATIAAAALAAVELVLLLVVGGKLLAQPEPAAAAKPARTAPTTPVTTKSRRPTSTVAAALSRGQMKVVVLNGNGRSGAAAAAASRVTRRGYRIGLVGNASSHAYPRSIVMYRRGFADEGRRLARDLGVGIVTPLDGMRAGQLAGAHAVLILGA